MVTQPAPQITLEVAKLLLAVLREADEWPQDHDSPLYAWVAELEHFVKDSE